MSVDTQPTQQDRGATSQTVAALRPPGTRARLLAASAFFGEDRYAEARTEFAKVLSSEVSGPLAAQAAFGVAASLDALDKIDEAAAKYQEVIAQFSDDSVAGEAPKVLASSAPSGPQSR